MLHSKFLERLINKVVVDEEVVVATIAIKMDTLPVNALMLADNQYTKEDR